MNGRPAVVFWDFDGTLAHRPGLWFGALCDALRSVDSSWVLSADQVRPHLQRGFPWHDAATTRVPGTATDWWRTLSPVLLAALTANSVPLALANAAVERVPAEFYRPGAWRVQDGAHDALSATRSAGFRNVILSNHGPELPMLVQALGLADVIERTITSAVVGAEKPHPAIFSSALESVDAEASECWMVGDNPVADIRGAEAVGMRGVLVSTVDGVAGVSLRQAAHHILSLSSARDSTKG